MSFHANITVLQDFDGLNPVVVEVISRKVQSTGKGTKSRYYCSYKGKNFDVFGLPRKAYNVPTGNCISLRSGF